MLLLLVDALPCAGVPGPEEQRLLWLLWQRELWEAICGELRGGQTPELFQGALSPCAGHLEGGDK